MTSAHSGGTGRDSKAGLQETTSRNGTMAGRINVDELPSAVSACELDRSPMLFESG